MGTRGEQQQKHQKENIKRENGKKNEDGCTLCSFQFSHTDLRVVERNETHATLWCETNLQQIIFNIRKNGGAITFEAKWYERNGSLFTAETSILVNETVNATCIARTRSRSEMDCVTLIPYEGMWNLDTILTHC